MLQLIAIIKLIPEFLELFRFLVRQISLGIDEKVLKNQLYELRQAIDDKNRRKAAKRLDDIFMD